jgi:hypothetical protein
MTLDRVQGPSGNTTSVINFGFFAAGLMRWQVPGVLMIPPARVFRGMMSEKLDNTPGILGCKARVFSQRCVAVDGIDICV